MYMILTMAAFRCVSLKP